MLRGSTLQNIDDTSLIYKNDGCAVGFSSPRE